MSTTRRSLTLLVASIALLGSAGAQSAVTAAERYRKLLAEYDRVGGGGAANDDERRQAIGRAFRHHCEIARQLVELAKQFPADPVAFDALVRAVWQVNTTPWPLELVGADDATPEALALLQRDHVRSGKLAPLCQRISYGFRAEYATFLRAVLASNEVRSVRGAACLSLAHLVDQRSQRLDGIRAVRERVEEFELLFGRDYVQGLLREDPAKTTREAVALYEEAAAEYADVELEGGDLVGARAGAALFEIRHLRAGAEAPEIEGDDQDGLRFKLSDYRGKVVLLDFWHQQ